MNIGEPVKITTIKPIREPIPLKEPAREEPVYIPHKPEREPARV